MITALAEVNTNKPFADLERQLRELKFLPLPSGGVEGRYIHKTKLGTKHSLLITGQNDDFNIYELIHHEGKKVILGTGKDAVVREAINLKTGKHVAIKLYPMYDKKSCPRKFAVGEAIQELRNWVLTTKVNILLPNTFVKLHEFQFAGDKSTDQNPEHRISYVITEKHDLTLQQLMEKKEVPLDTIHRIFSKLLIKHKNLIGKGYIYTDSNFCNVLLDSNLEPIFCDPEALSPPGTGLFPGFNILTGKTGFYIGMMMSLTRFFVSRLGLKGDAKEEVAKIQEEIGKFLGKIDTLLFNSEPGEKAIDDKITEEVKRFFANVSRDFEAKTPLFTVIANPSIQSWNTTIQEQYNTCPIVYETQSNHTFCSSTPAICLEHNLASDSSTLANVLSTIGGVALTGAAYATIPEVLGDALRLCNIASEQNAEYIKIAANVALIALSGSWLATGASWLTTVALIKAGCSKSTAKIAGNTTAIAITTIKNFSLVGVTATVISYAASKIGFWTEKRIVEQFTPTQRSENRAGLV